MNSSSIRGYVIPEASVRLARKVFVYLLLLSTVPRAGAQQTLMDAPAAQLIGPILQSKQHSLAIFDFSGPDKKMTALGEKLADDLRAAIAKSTRDLQVVDRSRIEEERKENLYAPEIILDLPSALLFAHKLGAKAFLVGEMSLGQTNVLTVDLKAYRVSNGEWIRGLRLSFRLNEEMVGLMAKSISPYTESVESKTAGYSPPRCLYCPKAEYPSDAIAERVEGNVELTAIVGEDGRVTNISVAKGLSGGLTAAAIDSVKKWKLTPAFGPDGKPAPMHVVLEISFQLR